MAYPSTWNSSAPVISQFNKYVAGVPQPLSAGDGNVLFLPGDGDPSQVDFGIVTVTDAAQTDGSSFSSPAKTRTSGADGTWAGGSRRRRDFYNNIFGFEQANHAVEGAVGFASPLAGAADCHPCPGASVGSEKWGMIQWACAFGENPDDILTDDGGTQLWEFTLTGPMTWTPNGRVRSTSTVSNNGIGATFTIAESTTRGGGPGGVLLPWTLQSDNVTAMPNAWIKGLTTIAPPSVACGSAARGWDSLLATSAGVIAGDFPTPAGG